MTKKHLEQRIEALENLVESTLNLLKLQSSDNIKQIICELLERHKEELEKLKG
jgi:hypothetical protein